MSDETPDDVATLYSWANLRGAKYRDFSSTRARVRENARQRVQEAIAAERERAQQATAEAVKPSPVTAGTPLKTSALENSAVIAPPRGISPGPLPNSPSTLASAPPTPAPSVDAVPTPRPLRAAGVAPVAPATQAPQWFALKNIAAGTVGRSSVSQAASAPAAARAPVVAVFSLAGGVGKSSLVATLGRTLSARGERVLLVETAAFGTLQFFFGAQEEKPGVLRTFLAPEASSSKPIDLLTLDADDMAQASLSAEPLTQEIQRNARDANRILVDLSTASGITVRRILRMSPTMLIPVTPDVRSVATVSAIESFFQRNPSGAGHVVSPFYVLNQYDEGTRLHQDVRQMLGDQIGDRLLPFALRRTPLVSEALAEGLTVVDYAPGSPVAKDYENLAEWVRKIAAPTEYVYRAVRWRER